MDSPTDRQTDRQTTISLTDHNALHIQSHRISGVKTAFRDTDIDTDTDMLAVTFKSVISPDLNVSK